jgi:four helix bundle protein
VEQVSYQFEKLIVWQEAKELTKAIYKLLAKFPRQEDYVLCDQIRRAAISVPSNIAEQSGRTSFKEKIHFLEIAYGSLMEAYCQLQIACELDYITINDLETIKPLIFKTSRLISGLRNNYVKKAAAS